MTTINDGILTATGGPTINDGLSTYYSRVVGESLNDAEYRWLGEQGATASQLNDRWLQFLRGEGYTGALPDMLRTYWVTGEAPAPTAPVITLQPIAQSITVGDTLTLSASASGAVSQQWYLDGGAISGATATTYTKSNAQLADDGNYFCRFTNAVDFTDTNIVAGTVTAASGGDTLTFNGTTQYGTI